MKQKDCFDSWYIFFNLTLGSRKKNRFSILQLDISEPAIPRPSEFFFFTLDLSLISVYVSSETRRGGEDLRRRF